MMEKNVISFHEVQGITKEKNSKGTSKNHCWEFGHFEGK
jgi:hypothetical protein